MSLRWFGFLLIASTFAVGVRAADLGGCEAHLVTDLYYGAFVSGLETQALTNADLAAAVASDVPVNALATTSNLSRNSSAKRLFAKLILEPTVKTLWPETRKKLATLLAQRSGNSAISDRARTLTERVVAPHEVRTLPLVLEGSDVALSDDGKPVVAYFNGRGKTVNVMTLTDGATIARHDFPGESTHIAVSFHRDRSGLDGFHYFNLLKNDEYLVNLSLWGSDNYVFNRAGKLIAARRDSPVSKVFLLNDDRPLFVTSQPRAHQLTATLDGKEEHLTVPGSGWNSEGVKVFQPPNGKIYLAHARAHGGLRTVDFYDIGGDKTPFYSPSWNCMNPPQMHWFTDAEGSPLLGVGTYDGVESKLIIFDPLLQREIVSIPIPGRIEGWRNLGADTYFWINFGNTLHVYSMLARSK